ncbi:peptide ABC transporter ATP-binding protein [Mycoplasma testudineum]|nr:peptide ABC transporter ATP-binding protein [Mycoplasma testudineum]
MFSNLFSKSEISLENINSLGNVYVEKPEGWFDKLKGKYGVAYRPVVKNLEARFTEAESQKQTVLKLRHIDVNYGSAFRKFKAVKDVSLNIYKGEILGLVGESGSGKSTMGNVIAGLVNRSFGSMEVLGKSVPKKRSRIKKDLRYFLINKIQMIFQDPAGSLNPHKNIFKITKEGLDNLTNLKSLFLKMKIDEIILKLDEKIKEYNLENTLNWNLKNLEELNKNSTNQAIEFLFSKFNTKIKALSKDSESIELKRIAAYLAVSKTEVKNLQSSNLRKEKREWIINTLKSVGLDSSVLERYPLEFSGGQQQRIGITRSLVMRPTLLIADEPISALDVSIQAQVINIFNDLKDEYDLTMLLIAHDLRMVEYVSDRIAVMYKGRIVEIGKSHDIAKNSYHPYTKSLLDAIPSLESKQGSLIGYVYNPEMHKYTDKIQPEWIQISQDHFILATHEEFNQWKNGNY